MHAVVAPPAVPMGQIKSFGLLGPQYQVGQALNPLDDGDWMVELTLVETGEKVACRWTRSRNDPDAH